MSSWRTDWARGWAAALMVWAAAGWGESIAIPHNQDAAPGPARTVEEALAHFTVPAGFEVQAVASEPDVINPVAMTWDDRGRIWVCESVEYPRLDAGRGRDRVRIHEDSDGDGDTDFVRTFAEGLNIPCGVAVGYGGAFVANAPNLLFYRDVNGDDVADVSEVLVTGFGRKDVHELPNNLTWGPDGWLYGLNGVFNPSRIEHQGKVHEFTCALWRYHPVSREFEVFCEGTSNPWGLDYNLEGDWFVSACVIDHLWHLTQSGYYHRQGGPYPPNTWKIESIVEHKHQKAAYCGLAFYYGDQYPEEYRGDLFMGNIHFGGINRDRLERNGSTYRAGAQADFMAGNDVWHMPVSVKVGPDGNFWVLDWYDRYHCYQDAMRDPEGIDRGSGRIWRITYGEPESVEKLDFQNLGDAQLMELLAHPNGWRRRTARRILVERNSAETAAELAERVRASSKGVERMECLWALMGMRRMEEELILELLRDVDGTVRRWAVHAAAERRSVSDELMDALAARGQDEEPAVRLEAVIASGRIDHPRSFELLAAAAKHPDEDRLIPHIVWQNVLPRIEREASRFSGLLREASSDGAPILAAMADRGAALLLDHEIATRSRGEAEAVFSPLLAGDSPMGDRAIGAVWGRIREGRREGVERLDFPPEVVESLISQMGAGEPTSATATGILAAWGDARGKAEANRVLEDADAPLASRGLMAHALRIGDATEFVREAARRLAAGAGTPRLQLEILSALQESGREEAPGAVLAAWRELDAKARDEALEMLTRRKAWAAAVIDAVSAGRVEKEAFRPHLIRRLAEHQDPEIDGRAEKVWGEVRRERNRSAESTISRVYRIVDKGEGDPVAGMVQFDRLCAQCHQLYGHGKSLGPDLSGVGRDSLDLLLSNVFDPNLVIGDGYQAWSVWTVDGETFTGLLAEQTEEQVVLKLEGGEEARIARGDIEEIRESELSLMPEGLDRGLSEQELRDLIAFLLTAEAPRPWADVLIEE